MRQRALNGVIYHCSTLLSREAATVVAVSEKNPGKSSENYLLYPVYPSVAVFEHQLGLILY